MKAHHPCNLCGGEEVSPLATRDRAGRALRTVLCNGCGLAWTDPLPNAAALHHYYSREYRADYKGVREPQPRHILRAGTVALERLARLRPLFTSRPPLLDVGAGGGEFVYLARRLTGCDVWGVEPNEGYGDWARRAYGAHVMVSALADAPLPVRHFRLVTLFHVLEHMPDPAATLARIAGLLAPGGHLVVEVPNAEAVCQSPWGMYHSAHLYHFNAATLEQAGLRAGLQPVSTRLSSDGGNLEVLFTTAGRVTQRSSWAIPGNAARVAAIRAAHRWPRHALTPHPYARALRKLTRCSHETLQLAASESPAALLDRLARARAPSLRLAFAA
jgi:SAM-dependent methyltransferase